MLGRVDALEFTVDEGRPAAADRFFGVGVDLPALLDELTELSVAWRVGSLRTCSAVAVLSPPDDAPEEDRHLRLVVDALGGVRGMGPLPDDWTPDAVRAAHRSRSAASRRTARVAGRRPAYAWFATAARARRWT